jgi:hypothetical protein
LGIPALGHSQLLGQLGVHIFVGVGLQQMVGQLKQLFGLGRTMGGGGDEPKGQQDVAMSLTYLKK